MNLATTQRHPKGGDIVVGLLVAILLFGTQEERADDELTDRFSKSSLVRRVSLWKMWTVTYTTESTTL